MPRNVLCLQGEGGQYQIFQMGKAVNEGTLHFLYALPPALADKQSDFNYHYLSYVIELNLLFLFSIFCGVEPSAGHTA